MERARADSPAADEQAPGMRHRLVGPRRVAGNGAVRLLIDGAETYPAMLEAIAQAQRSICFESYIFASDGTAKRFVDALAERARAGVSVRVMIDGIGSLGTDMSSFQPLREAGGEVVQFGPPTPWRRVWSLWRRDHRKILVVDDVVAFIGGINISDEYAPPSWGGGAWHDAHARFEGPAARELTKLFDRQWRQATGEQWSGRLGPPVQRGERVIQILESLLTRRYSVRRAYLHAIRSATSTIRICNAYCIPDRGFRRALRNACARGVKVQLIFAGKTDVRAVHFASRRLYSRLLRWGVEIYEWTDRVLHAKTAVIDGEWCTIGSYNIDTRSLLYNYEANIACVDRDMGAQMDAAFERDLAKCVRIEPHTWHRRPPIEKLLELVFFQLRYIL